MTRSNNKGGALIEYTMLIMVVALLCMAGVKALGLGLFDSIDNTGKAIASM